jgi:ribosomal protein L19
VNVDLKQTIIKKYHGRFNEIRSRRIRNKKRIPSFAAGDTITVYYEIREGEKREHSFSKVL